MKKIKMKTIMAGATRTANIGDIILVDDNFADELIKSGSAELIEEIIEIEVEQEQEVEVEEIPEQEVEIKKEPQKKSKKRKR